MACGRRTDERLINACCCCDLRAGSIVSAVLWIILSGVELLTSISFFIAMCTRVNYEEYHYYYDNYNNKYIELAMATAMSFFVTLMIVNQLAASIGLLVGIKRRSIQLMLWWIATVYTRLVLNVLSLIIGFSMFCIYWHMHRDIIPEFGFFSLIFVPAVVVIYFNVHTLVCVISHRRVEVRDLAAIPPEGPVVMSAIAPCAQGPPVAVYGGAQGPPAAVYGGAQGPPVYGGAQGPPPAWPAETDNAGPLPPKYTPPA